MPIYEYMCRGCGSRNEFLEGVTQEQEEKVCSECGGSDLHKLISMTNFTITSSAPASCGADGCACAEEGHGGGGCCGGFCEN